MMHRRLLVTVLCWLWATPGLAQVNAMVVPFVFSPGATVSSSEVNTNFSTLFTNAVDRTNGTMLGPFQTRTITPTADAAYDLGSAAYRFKDLWLSGVVRGTGSTSFIATGAPQFTVGYSTSAWWTTSVSSVGTVTFNATGSTPKFVFTSGVEFAAGATGITGSVPSGMVAFFDLAACPTGWDPYGTGDGRYVVGVSAGKTIGPTSIVGTALTDKEDRATGRHTHSVTVPAAGSDAGGSGNGDAVTGTQSVTTDATGAVESTNAPYVQLLVCKKS